MKGQTAEGGQWQRELTANLRGFNASNGKPIKNDTMKQTAAPPQHSKNPKNLSHLDRAK